MTGIAAVLGSCRKVVANANPSISGISMSVTTTSIAVPEESAASACVAEGTATT